MNWKLVFLGLVGVGIFVWLLDGWYTAVDREEVQTTVPVTNTAASNSPPVTYIASSTKQEVVLELQSDQSVATLRGLGYAALPLRAIATTTAGKEVYRNANELVRAVVAGEQLQVFVADTALFQGVATTSTVFE